MKKSTLSNLIQLIVIAILGVSALAGVLFCAAWWHLFTFAMCALLGYVIYTDDAYGTESVRAYFKRISKEKRS